GAVGRLTGRRRKGKKAESDAQLKAAPAEEKPAEAAPAPKARKKDYVTYAEDTPAPTAAPEEGVEAAEDKAE
ncbi:MAG TPA: hypothetical protein PK071_02150, partial [Atopobiaceae bacterium]|nr:hypothetical protein [Atopobiaceae bacterium]